MSATASGRTLLIVEDDAALREMLEINLRRAGYTTLAAQDGPGGLRQAVTHRPDLVILDVMLPGLSGTELASRLRADPVLRGTPVIMVTARAEEMDELVGLAVGADDYITKPFSIKVLLARIEAVLRRAASRGATGRKVRIGELEVDLDAHEATAAGRAVKLTLTEFRILAALVGAEGRVLTRQELISTAIGSGVMVTDRTIDVHVTGIRRKLGSLGGLIVTVRGVGYRVGEGAATGG